jgi:uncharacterized protein YggT (Ycf19 family)
MDTLRRRSAFATAARAVTYLAYAWVIASMIILVFGFFLLLFNANPDAGFSEWVYRQLARVMEPFRGIFPTVSTSEGSTLDVSILFAMLVYGLLGLGVKSLIDWVTYRRENLAQRIERDELRLRRSRESAQDAARPSYPATGQQAFPQQGTPGQPQPPGPGV